MSQRVDIATGVDSTTSKTADSSIGERRRSSRLHPPYTTDGIDVSVAPRRRQQNINVKIKNEIANEDESYAENDDNGKDGGASPALYSFGGRQFKSYQEMVQAKRERNQQVLEESGLLSVMRNVKVEKLKTAAIVKSARTQLIKKRKADDLPQEKRKSNRLQGIESDGKYIDEERNGQVSVASETGLNGTPTLFISNNNREDKRHRFKAVDPGEDSSVQEALTFVHTILLTPLGTTASTSSSAFKLEEPTLTTKKSPRSVIVTNDENQKTVEPMKVAAMEADSVVSMEKTLSLSSREIHVAKVCPERIYSMAMHPSSSQVIACAGDKVGNVGIWNVTHASSLNDATTSNHSGVYLFRAHQSSVNCVQWTPDGSCLFSSSYDGSVRWFDAKAEISTEIFATFDDSNDSHRTKLGFGLDTGSKFWTQYGCLDHRFTGQKCFFLSTSTGSALHVDLRANERFTFHEQLSVKKINTLWYVLNP